MVDGNIIPASPWDPEASPYSADVPLLVGTVLNELTNSIQMGRRRISTQWIWTKLKNRLTAQYGDKADLYGGISEVPIPKRHRSDLFSRHRRLARVMNAVAQAERKAAQGAAPAYVYWFQWQTPVLDGRPRAFHCSELPFVFYNTERCAEMTGVEPGRELVLAVADAWINFARKGIRTIPGFLSGRHTAPKNSRR